MNIEVPIMMSRLRLSKMTVLKYYVENKPLFDTYKNEANENKVLSHSEALRCETIKNNKTLFSFMSNVQTYYHSKLDFQKVDQHTGGKWLIHGTKRHNDNIKNFLIKQISM